MVELPRNVSTGFSINPVDRRIDAPARRGCVAGSRARGGAARPRPTRSVPRGPRPAVVHAVFGRVNEI